GVEGRRRLGAQGRNDDRERRRSGDQRRLLPRVDRGEKVRSPMDGQHPTRNTQHLSPAWPGGASCAAGLSFDEDAEAAWLWRDPANAGRRVLLSMGQYGPRVGTPEILRLLRERELPATFFIPGWTIERYPATVEQILAAGHEVGAHGYLHERTDTLDPEEE